MAAYNLAVNGEMERSVMKSDLNALLFGAGDKSMSEWIEVKIGNPLPDDVDGAPILGPEDDMKVWAYWDDGKAEVSHYHYIGMNKPVFQRQCGTDEGCEGWEGNVGHVTHWMEYRVPEAPK